MVNLSEKDAMLAARLELLKIGFKLNDQDMKSISKKWYSGIIDIIKICISNYNEHFDIYTILFVF